MNATNASPSPVTAHPTMMMPSGFHGAFSVAEFCKRYGISRSKAYEEHKAGRLAFWKVGTRTLIMIGEGERWASALQVVK